MIIISARAFRAGFSFVVAAIICVSPAPASSRDSQWRQDLAALASQLPAQHASLFFKISRQQFDRAVADLDARIPSLQDHEVVVGLMRIVAMVGDAHTSLRWNAPGSGFRNYALRLYWFSDGLYVTQTGADYERALGRRVIRIGDTDVALVEAALAALIPHENDYWLKELSPGLMVVPEVLNALGIVSDMDRARFTLEDAGGATFDMEFVPVPGNQTIVWNRLPDGESVPLPLYQKNSDAFYWYQYLPNAKTVYMKYNVAAISPTWPAEAFAAEIADFVNSHPVERFILDIRDNGGGDSSVIFRLLAGLRTRTDLNAPDRFFVVIGRKTFSSAMFNAVDLKQGTQATLVGEPTGGKPNAYGEVRSLILPQSGLRISYSTKYFQLLPDDPPAVFPDIFISLSSSDFFAGRDPVLERILAPSRSRRRP